MLQPEKPKRVSKWLKVRTWKILRCHDTKLFAIIIILLVLGSCSTKLVHIIRCVKEIIDANEKIIIFSSWAAMLNRMETALKNNGMPCFNVSGASDKHFNDKLKNFKFTASINVLLLPTNFACKGLNLPEASHVIFINSIINKADELQAIGRINRIGQTK